MRSIIKGFANVSDGLLADSYRSVYIPSESLLFVRAMNQPV